MTDDEQVQLFENVIATQQVEQFEIVYDDDFNAISIKHEDMQVYIPADSLKSIALALWNIDLQLWRLKIVK